MGLRIETEALRKEADSDSEAKLRLNEALEKTKQLQKQRDELGRQWSEERRRADEVKEATRQLDAARRDLETAQRHLDWTKCGELQYSIIPRLEAAARGGADTSSQFLADAVTEEHVLSVVSKATGIPVTQLAAREAEKLLHLEDTLRQRVVGQSEAVATVAETVRVARAGLRPHLRPIHLPLSRSHGSRKNGAVQGPRRRSLQRRKRHCAHRHVRIHGQAQRESSGRRSTRLCGVRGGGTADRTHPTETVSDSAV